VAIEMAREPHAKLSRVHAVVLAPALGGQLQGRGDDGVRARGSEGVVQGVTKAARFIHRVDFMARGDLLLHPGDELRAGELLRQRDGAPLALDGGDDRAHVHVQAQLENMAHWSVAKRHGVGSVVFVMKGWVVFFHTPRVPGRPTPGNPSWHLTARSHGCSNADALASPSLSLGR
jgi:hypothetical protein